MISAARVIFRILLSLWSLTGAFVLLSIFRYHLEKRSLRQRHWWR